MKPLPNGPYNPFLDILPKHLQKEPWESDETPVCPGSDTSDAQKSIFQKLARNDRETV